MIEVAFFYDELVRQGTDFFTGIPDSLLKSFCAYLSDHTEERHHIIPANEGAAVALACGYHLATGKIPLVYMQNSGIGNAVNPLLSLADPQVYHIPLILLIGWRGEPGIKDEPQHLKQGEVTLALLEAMNIPYMILANTEGELSRQLTSAYQRIAQTKAPYALVVPKDTFAPYTLYKTLSSPGEMSREEAIEEILCSSDPGELFFSTTGMASRELCEVRDRFQMGHERDFLTVGSMGHASQIALAVALHKPDRLVTCLDGDGAALMHLGAMGIIGTRKVRNFRHILLNNGAHDSVGGQPTVALQIDLPAIAKACGYPGVYSVSTRAALAALAAAKLEGPTFIEVRVHKGARKDLGRPCLSPEENKYALMRVLKGHNP
ncbi:MAG: phosphonopyruvate decarboxylase [Treponema sp.]|jgi:phosphonopyruvate decarboxylase|nr:phosphonopyruvate decarboxylase [Treponema sp.]